MTLRGHLHLHCPSIRVRVSVRAPDRILFTKAMAIFIACSSDHVHRQLWACALHNLGRTLTSTSEAIATCGDELGHGCLRQKYSTQTSISVNRKHQFSCFDCVRARTRMLRPKSRMLCKCTLIGNDRHSPCIGLSRVDYFKWDILFCTLRAVEFFCSSDPNM